jgi:fibronectin-binding autotransporter adhesin
MAQIIKHRRGSLESIGAATKRAGELLVVTGSSGITAANGNSILFIGIDGSTATPANKVLQGTSVPNLTGADYDTSIDGIPYYDTAAQKLYILNKGGNVEIKATANTGGTGIVSSSAQVTELLPVGTVSGSSQIVSILGPLNTFSASQETKDSTLATYTQSVDADLTELFATASNHEGRVDALEAFSSSLGDGFITEAELAAATGALESADSAIEGRLNNIEGFTSSIDTTIKTKLNVEGVISGSSQVQIDSVTGFTSFSSSVDTNFSASNASITSLSASVASVTGNFSSSVATTFANVEASQSIQNSRLNQLETDSGSQAGRLNNLESFSSSIETAITVNGSDVTVNGNFTVSGTTTTVNSTTVEIGDNIIQLNGSAAAFGGLIIVDTTAPNQVSGSLLWDAANDYWIAGASGSESKLLRANGDSVISGSSQVNADSITNFDTNVKDKLNADGVISGSSQVNADSITNFDENVKAKLDADGVISGSSQVQIDSVTGFSSFSSSVDSRVDALEAFSESLDAGFVTQAELASATGALETVNTAQSARLTSLEGFSGSQETKNSTLGTYTASVDSRLNQLSTDSGSQAGRLSSIESFTQSIDTTIKTKLDVEAVVSSSAQVVAHLLNQATDFGTGRVSADSIGNVDGTSTITGSFIGDGSQLTGLVTTLKVTGSNGSTGTVDLLTQGITFTSASGQGLGIAVSGQTVTFSNVNASTSAKGVASFDADDFSVSTGNVSIKANGVRAANLNADVAGTGLSLDGVDNSLEVDYGSTSGTAVEGNTNLTIQGTANEIQISSGSVTLGAGGTVTIGLPDSVTIATASIQNNLSVGNNLTVVGNLYVQGSTTTVDSTTIQLGDNILELNGSGAANGGLLVKDATIPNTVSGSLLWDSSNDYWKGGALNSEKEFARFNATPTSASVQVIGANGLLVDSDITDDGVVVTITTDLIINGLTANSFLVANGTKELTSVVPVNAGDLIQWNGSSFVASNTIDGGTF